MAPPQKGKRATKGAKQIVDENLATLKFYRNMAIVSNIIGLTAILIFYYTTAHIFWYIFSCVIYISAYQFMVYMSKPNYSQTGQLLDSGSDLNMEGGIGEHVKDVIILTSICQVLAIITNYMWFLWLFAPARIGWIIWKNILSPYFFQPELAENVAVNEKKQKKLERKQKRMANIR